MNFFKDDSETNPEAKVDLEMQSLYDFSMHSPATLAKRLKSLRAASSTDDSTVENDAASTPIPSPPKFPLPPLFLADSLGEKQLQLLHANNVKIKILILIVTLALVAGVVLGVWNVTIYYSNKTSHDPEDSAWVELEAKLETSLQAITRLSELVNNLTSSTQNSLTSSINTSKVSSWSGRPRYTWAWITLVLIVFYHNGF